MKGLLGLSLLMLVACGSSVVNNAQHEPEQNELLTQIKKAINKAQENHDYRLMYTLGRNPVIPGFESKKFAQLKIQCGVKPIVGTGDVVKTPKDKQARRLKYQFAVQYNNTIYELCQSARHK
jgi:hypothetical protein